MKILPNTYKNFHGFRSLFKEQKVDRSNDGSVLFMSCGAVCDHPWRKECPKLVLDKWCAWAISIEEDSWRRFTNKRKNGLE